MTHSEARIAANALLKRGVEHRINGWSWSMHLDNLSITATHNGETVTLETFEDARKFWTNIDEERGNDESKN